MILNQFKALGGKRILAAVGIALTLTLLTTAGVLAGEAVPPVQMNRAWLQHSNTAHAPGVRQFKPFVSVGWDVATNGIVSGYIWHDLNVDGVWNQGEPALDGWSVQALREDMIVDVAETGAGAWPDGYYELSLPPGSFIIEEVCPINWYQSFPAPIDICGSGPWTVTVTSGQVVSNNNFGNYQIATGSGYKWDDLNLDGVWQQPDEPAVSAWSVALLSGGVVIATDMTNEFGMYEFTKVMPGQTYLVCEEIQPGWSQTSPTMAAGVACPAGYSPYGYRITVQSGQIDADKNFGNGTPSGCTLNQGYWKTHSEYGPAPKDPGWYTASTLLGPNTLFFQSGQTWYQTFRAKSKRGDLYYPLAQQYMAAVLSVENGANPASLGATLVDAKALLANNSPKRQIARNSPDRAKAILLVDKLDSFNKGGLPGAPHCDDSNAGA